MRALPTRRSLLVLLACLCVAIVRSGGESQPAAAQQGLPPEAYRLVDTWLPDPQPRQPGQVTRAGGVDVEGDRVYLVDRAEGHVLVFDAGGQERLRIGSEGSLPGQLDDPRDVAVADGRVYVTDAGNRRVQVFEAAGGRFLALWESVGHPGGIASDGQRVYVSDLDAPRVTVFDRAGVQLAVWLAGDGSGLGLVRPMGMDVDPDNGHLLVADPGAERVFRITPEGRLERSIEPADDGPENLPFDVASAGDGIYAATADGITIMERGFLSFRSDRPIGLAGIAVGPGEALVASQNDAWRISAGLLYYPERDQLDRAFGGNFDAQRWGDLPAATGSLEGPRRVAATVDGGAFLADSWPRVQRWLTGGVPGSQFRADDLVDLVPAPGGDVYVLAGDVLRRVSDRGEVRWTWRAASGSWLAAGARAGDGLWALDAGRGQLLRFGPDGRAGGGEEGPVTILPYEGLIVDIAAGAGQILLADRETGALRLVAEDGSARASWAAPGRVMRLASSGDGAAWFALTDDGWIWKYDAQGQLRAAWDGSPEGSPIDLDVSPDGRVLVADGRVGRILVYGPDTDGRSAEPPKPGQRCDLYPDKRAAPARVPAGEPVEVTLEIAGDCPSEAMTLDVMLVIDQSGSMEGPKMAGARAAAIDFVTELDFGQVQAGVVLFASQIDLARELGGDPQELVRAIARADAGGGTNIADALEEAREELLGPRGRAGAAKALVLLTDGKPEGGFDPVERAREEARTTRDAGIALYSIGLGGDIDRDLMREMAGEADRYFEAPGAAELSRIYRRIARRLVTGTLLESITIIDEVPSNMVYVEGSSVPPARWDGRRLSWTLDGVTPSGTTLRYQLLPQQVGRWPTNVFAAGDYVDGVGYAGQVIFPVPFVDVYGSRIVYLPALFQRACPDQRSDIVVLIDTSTSMDEQSAGGGRTKMEAAIDAARSFVQLLDLPGDRASIVGFNGEATVVQGLTGDRGALNAALDRLPRDPGTRIDLGLEEARKVLTGPDRDDRNLPILVLLTDGRPAGGSEAATAQQAQAIRDAGIYVFTIGLGADADGALLVDLAGDAARYSYAPDQSALGAIYQTIAWSLPCR